ncbi:MAG TPA: hypothetical protein VKX45_02830 [Bryobacteraceae bacterium]|nr:hypothetical protein [Bryobacteraceae bacterium]
MPGLAPQHMLHSTPHLARVGGAALAAGGGRGGTVVMVAALLGPAADRLRLAGARQCGKGGTVSAAQSVRGGSAPLGVAADGAVRS